MSLINAPIIRRISAARAMRAGLLCATLPLAVAHALAQEAETLADIANADTLGTVVVTGSRIRSPNVEAVNLICFSPIAIAGIYPS